MDYSDIWDRWVALTMLPEEDRKALVSKMHEEVIAGVQALGTLAAAEIAKLLAEAKYEKKDAYLEAITPVLALSAFDGYLLSLIVSGINPDTANLAENTKLKILGDTWSKGYEGDQNKPYLEKIDPMVMLMLGKIVELRVNQALSFQPEIVDLPYKTVERAHQYIGWSLYQGYVIGMMQKEIA